MKKVSFDLTHVEYIEGDLVGFICAGLSLAPVFAIVAYTAVFISRREFITGIALVGQLVNTAINIVIKNIIAAPRPPNCGLSGHGMPSNHAQFVFFTLAFWSCHVCNMSVVKFSASVNGGMVYRHFIVLLLSLAALGVGFSRVYLEYHYLNQVVVGSFLGLVLGAMWYWVVQTVLRSAFKRWLEPSCLCRFFYIRDSAHVCNILQLEYDLSYKGREKSVPNGSVVEDSATHQLSTQKWHRRGGGRRNNN